MVNGYPSRRGIEESRDARDREARLHDRVRELKPTSSAEFVALEEVLRSSSQEPADESAGLYNGTKHSVEEARAAVRAAYKTEVIRVRTGDGTEVIVREIVDEQE